MEAIDRLCFVCGCIIMKNGHHILLVLKEAMSLTFERSIILLENVTSNNMSQLLGTEVSAIQRCPLFRGVRYSEVFILGFALIPAVPRKCIRYSEVSAISISAIAGFYCIHLWSFHRTADFCCWNHLHLFEVGCDYVRLKFQGFKCHVTYDIRLPLS